MFVFFLPPICRVRRRWRKELIRRDETVVVEGAILLRSKSNFIPKSLVISAQFSSSVVFRVHFHHFIVMLFSH